MLILGAFFVLGVPVQAQSEACVNGGGQHFCWWEVSAPDEYPHTAPEMCQAQGGGSYGHGTGEALDCSPNCGTSGACYWVDWHDPAPGCEPWTCSHGTPGDPGDPPPEASRRILGRVYDKDLGFVRFWQRADNYCGADNQTDGTNTLTVKNSGGASSGWDCNPQPYYVSYAVSSGEGPHAFTLTPPPGYACEDVTWSIDYIDNTFPDTSGTGCTANVSLGLGDWENQLAWKISSSTPTNNPPTAQITQILVDDVSVPVSSEIEVAPGSTIKVTGTANDLDSNLSQMQFIRVQYDPATGGNLTSYIGMPSTPPTCSGDTCTATYPQVPAWTPSTNDSWWWLYVDAADSTTSLDDTGDQSNGRCSGHPGDDTNLTILDPPLNNWSDCGSSSRIKIHVIEPATVDISGNIGVVNTCSDSVDTAAFDPATGIDVRFYDGSTNYTDSGATTSYNITDVPPGQGTLYATTSVSSASGGSFDLACMDGQAIVPTSGLVLTAPDDFPADIGYTYNPSADTWFTAIDGDVYGNSISITIPDTATNFEPYLVSQETKLDEVAFAGSGGISISPGDSAISEIGIYAKLVGNDFWPLALSFDPPATCDEGVCSVSDLDNLKTGEVYTISLSDLNDWLAANTTYALDGDPGVTVIYVEDTVSGDLLGVNFTQNITSADTDKRVFLVTKTNVTIGSSTGYPPLGFSVPTSTDDPHIQMGFATQNTLLLTTGGASSDKAVILEGPIFASNLTSLRDLGLGNATYPAFTVKYNQLYLREVLPASGMMVSDVVWAVGE